jgi:hypothetical protein
MATAHTRSGSIALCLALSCGCTHYPDIKGDNPEARAWSESQRKQEEEERARTRNEQARDQKAIPDPDHAALPPPPPASSDPRAVPSR